MTVRNGHARAFTRPILKGSYRPNTALRQGYYPELKGAFRPHLDIPAMLREATTILGLETLKAPIHSARWTVKANSRDVQQWVDKTLRYFWLHDLKKALQVFEWGTQPGEVLWNLDPATGLLEYEGLEEVNVYDVRALVRGRELGGFEVTGGYTRSKVVVKSPHCFWIAFDAPPGDAFGRSRLAGAWSAWMDKCGPKGAEEIARLWFFKNAYNGGFMKHPAGGQIELPNGTTMSNEDYARQIVEKMETGGVGAMPSNVYEDSKIPMWEYIEPKLNGDPQFLLAYVESLSEKQLIGMGIFPEIIKAADTGGGWSGRSVPMLQFLNARDLDVKAILSAIDRCIIKPGVRANFGKKAKYRIEPVSLVPKTQDGQQAQAPVVPPAQQTGGNPQAIMGAQGPQPVQMSQSTAPSLFVPLDDSILSLALAG